MKEQSPHSLRPTRNRPLTDQELLARYPKGHMIQRLPDNGGRVVVRIVEPKYTQPKSENAKPQSRRPWF